MLRHIDSKTRIDRVTLADADRIRVSLLERLARSTSNKLLRVMRQLFNVAVARGLIKRNPFGHIKGWSRGR